METKHCWDLAEASSPSHPPFRRHDSWIDWSFPTASSGIGRTGLSLASRPLAESPQTPVGAFLFHILSFDGDSAKEINFLRWWVSASRSRRVPGSSARSAPSDRRPVRPLQSVRVLPPLRRRAFPRLPDWSPV